MLLPALITGSEPKKRTAIPISPLRLAVLCLLSLLLASCDMVGKKQEESFFLAKPGPILFLANPDWTYEGGGSTQLYSMEPNGSNVQKLTNDSTAQILDAVWSPNGQEIALVIQEARNGPYSKDGIYIVDADGFGLHRLIGSNAQFLNVADPVWSPDGQRIAFTAQLPPEPLDGFGLFTIDINGENLHQVGSSTALLPQRIDGWSADGERLLGDVFDPRMQNVEGKVIANGTIITINLNGTVLDTLLQTQGAPDYMEPYTYPGVPSWSNGGHRLAFRHCVVFWDTYQDLPIRTKQEDIYVANADGSEAHPVTNQEYQFIYPIAWSPDDAAILAKADNPYPNRRPFIDPSVTEHIVIMQADGSSLKEITPFTNKRSASYMPTSWRR